MRLTVIGCGDAFGSGGRFNTCFHVRAARSTILLDCGASSLVALRQRGIDLNSIDGVILSHLHGDHFGALPFLLLDANFISRRERPFTIAGPPGTRARLTAAIEVFFPKSSEHERRFTLDVTEIAVGRPTPVLGFTVTTVEVVHQSGAPSTAVRLDDGASVLAYSGDTEWTDALMPVADGAALFICECNGYAGSLKGHLTWETLKPHLARLNAKRMMLTHMGTAMLAHADEARAAGLLVAEDGLEAEV